MELDKITPERLGDVRQIIITADSPSVFSAQVFTEPDGRVFDGAGEGPTLAAAIEDALADMEEG